jgi:hypothetical protein
VAELADVEQALVDVLIAASYPNGPDSLSSAGVPVRIYRGRPTNAALIADRTTGTVDVSVFPLAEATRNTTRWGVQVSVLPSPSTLTVGVSGNSANFAGVAISGDLGGALINYDQAFVYQAQAGDSAALVAAALGAAIRASMICSVTGATLTVPGAFNLVARTASRAQALQEWSRQEQGFQISIWAPTPVIRDRIAQVIGAALTQINFLTLADGTGGRLRYRATANFDGDQAASMYRRDLTFDVEYGTTVMTSSPTMLFGDLDCNSTTIFA